LEPAVDRVGEDAQLHGGVFDADLAVLDRDRAGRRRSCRRHGLGRRHRRERFAYAGGQAGGVENFFTSPASAQDWLASHLTVSGIVLSQGQALRLGVDIFGHLLDD
jgi:hypothetical protein